VQTSCEDGIPPAGTACSSLVSLARLVALFHGDATKRAVHVAARALLTILQSKEFVASRLAEVQAEWLRRLEVGIVDYWQVALAIVAEASKEGHSSSVLLNAGGKDVISPSTATVGRLVTVALRPTLALVTASVASVVISAPALGSCLNAKEAGSLSFAEMVALSDGHTASAGQCGQIASATVNEAANVSHSRSCNADVVVVVAVRLTN
jgi:hypothetical protein